MGRPVTKEVEESTSSHTLNELGHSMTGGQIQEALDYLIYQSLEPIVLYSDIFDIQVAHLLAVASTNRKRKLSALEREDFISKLCNALYKKGEEKLEILRGCKIERGFVYNFVVNFLKHTHGYRDLYCEHLMCPDFKKKQILERRLTVVETNVGFTREFLYQTIGLSESWLELAYSFRNKIVMQYQKHSLKQAKSFCDMKGENFDFNDVSQNLLTAVTKAVDKYDSGKGALTSYINFWILNAQTYANPEHGHEYNVAYTIPQIHKKNIAGVNTSGSTNFSVSLDAMLNADDEGSDLLNLMVGDEGVDKSLEARNEIDNMLYLIKAADLKGIGRLYLDIDEFFSAKEQRLMAKTMRDQLGIKPSKS